MVRAVLVIRTFPLSAEFSFTCSSQRSQSLSTSLMTRHMGPLWPGHPAHSEALTSMPNILFPTFGGPFCPLGEPSLLFLSAANSGAPPPSGWP